VSYLNVAKGQQWMTGIPMVHYSALARQSWNVGNFLCIVVCKFCWRHNQQYSRFCWQWWLWAGWWDWSTATTTWWEQLSIYFCVLFALLWNKWLDDFHWRANCTRLCHYTITNCGVVSVVSVYCVQKKEDCYRFMHFVLVFWHQTSTRKLNNTPNWSRRQNWSG